MSTGLVGDLLATRVLGTWTALKAPVPLGAALNPVCSRRSPPADPTLRRSPGNLRAVAAITAQKAPSNFPLNSDAAHRTVASVAATAEPPASHVTKVVVAASSGCWRLRFAFAAT